MNGQTVYIVIDWVLIVGVIVLVIAVYWMIGQIIDACIGMWHEGKEER